MSQLNVQELREAIRIAESAGDTVSVNELKLKLEKMSINS